MPFIGEYEYINQHLGVGLLIGHNFRLLTKYSAAIRIHAEKLKNLMVLELIFPYNEVRKTV